MFEFVIPARNEQDRIDRIVRLLKSAADRVRVVVVDNASRDATAELARRAGADTVVPAPRIGKGHAVAAGVRACTGEQVLLCDADIQGLDPRRMIELAGRVAERGLPLGRLALHRCAEDAPVTTLTARPLLRQFGVDRVAEPLGGLAAVSSRFILDRHLPGGWGFDVALTLAALDAAGDIVEVPAPEVSHRRRALTEYVDMADDVVAAILTHFRVLRCDPQDCIRCPAPAGHQVEPVAAGGR